MKIYIDMDEILRHCRRFVGQEYDDPYLISAVPEEVIRSLPPADVVERKKGKWIKMSDADGIYWACSECGEELPRIAHFNPQFDLFSKMKSINKTNYCPSCGAKMDGGQNDGI